MSRLALSRMHASRRGSRGPRLGHRWSVCRGREGFSFLPQRSLHMTLGPFTAASCGRVGPRRDVCATRLIASSTMRALPVALLTASEESHCLPNHPIEMRVAPDMSRGYSYLYGGCQQSSPHMRHLSMYESTTPYPSISKLSTPQSASTCVVLPTLSTRNPMRSMVSMSRTPRPSKTQCGRFMW